VQGKIAQGFLSLFSFLRERVAASTPTIFCFSASVSHSFLSFKQSLIIVCFRLNQQGPLLSLALLTRPFHIFRKRIIAFTT
jgi:hypothetical protein